MKLTIFAIIGIILCGCAAPSARQSRGQVPLIGDFHDQCDNRICTV